MSAFLPASVRVRPFRRVVSNLHGKKRPLVGFMIVLVAVETTDPFDIIRCLMLHSCPNTSIFSPQYHEM